MKREGGDSVPSSCDTNDMVSINDIISCFIMAEIPKQQDNVGLEGRERRGPRRGERYIPSPPGKATVDVVVGPSTFSGYCDQSKSVIEIESQLF